MFLNHLKEIEVYFIPDNKKVKIRGEIDDIILEFSSLLRGTRENSFEDEISIVSSLRLE